jgi:hypothetical protein
LNNWKKSKMIDRERINNNIKGKKKRKEKKSKKKREI